MPGCAPIYGANIVTGRVLDDPERPCAGSRFRFGQNAGAGDLIGLRLRSQAERIDQKHCDDQSADTSHGVEHHRQSNTVAGHLFETGSVNVGLSTLNFADSLAVPPSDPFSAFLSTAG